MHSSPVEPDPFLAHAGFLRRLARHLVQDEHDREDLLQEAWAAASVAGTSAAGRPLQVRAWLARVLRNRASNLRRERARRAEREQAVAREESVDASVERELGVQEQVLAAVSELREPYRTAIVLRYYRDLPPAAIARELGVPVATIDTRLLRARALLRERLTRELGGREAWLAALLPLCPSGSSSAPVGLSTGKVLWMGVVGMKLKIVLCALAALAVGAWQLQRTGERVRPSAAAATPPHATPLLADQAPAQAVLPAPSGAERAAVEAPVALAPAQPSPAADAPARSGRTLRGIVLDPEGAPLAAARVRFTPDGDDRAQSTRVAQSDAAGRFELVGLAGPGRALADEPGWTTVVAGALVEGVGAGETTLVAAPARELALRVVDESGRALSAVQVSVVVPSALYTRFEHGFERSESVRRGARTDAEGACALVVPALPGTALELAKDGCESLRHALDLPSLSRDATTPLTLVLRHLSEVERILEGRVVDRMGDGVAEARVELGNQGTRSDAAGWFHFDLSQVDPFANWMGGERLPARITAVRAGLLPAVLEVERDADGAPLWPDLLVLQLVEETLSIAGRVVDQRGEPLPDAVVFLPQAHLIAGETTLEAEMRGGSEDFFLSERSDAQGRFEFRGLLDLPYDVAAYQPDTLLRGELPAVPAGTTGVEIRIDTGDLWREVRGQVVSRDGHPLAGVTVTPFLKTQEARGSTGHWVTGESLKPTRTDPAGKFVLRNVPREHMTASLSSAEIMHSDGHVFTTDGAREDEHGNLNGCVLVASLRLRFQIVLDDPAEADSFRVLDEAGTELLPITQMANSYTYSDGNVRLTEGRSLHVFVAEEARTLVLLRAGSEVRRMPLRALPGEEARVR